MRGIMPRVKIHVYTGGPVACNGYLLETAEGCVAVDAPLGFADWARTRVPHGGEITHLLLTHQHFDHVQDAARLQEATGCRIHAVFPYSSLLTLQETARSWGIPPVEPYRVDDAFGRGGASGDWGGERWRALAIPGHSSDGAAYYLEEHGVLFVGDIIFAGSIGRTDFPEGSQARLLAGIREKIMPLPPETQIMSGHGPATTLQEELLNNPYLT